MFPKNRNNQNVFTTKDSENMIVWKKKVFVSLYPNSRGKVRQTCEIKGVKWDTPITHDHNTFEVMWPFYFEAPHFISYFPLHRPLAIIVKYSCIDFLWSVSVYPISGVKWDKQKQKSSKTIEKRCLTLPHAIFKVRCLTLPQSHIFAKRGLLAIQANLQLGSITWIYWLVVHKHLWYKFYYLNQFALTQ